MLVDVVFVSPTALASTEYQYDVWRADDGLPQSTVTSIVQTPDGFLWLGTQNGLVRFDGVHFKVFNANNTSAIKNDRVVQLFVDRSGALWISAEQGELVCLKNGSFNSYTMPGKGSPFNYARSMCDDAEGHLWVVSCEWQLIRFGQEGFAVLSTNWNLKGGQPDAVASDLMGNIWVQTEQEMAMWQKGGFKSMWNETNDGNFHNNLGRSRTEGVWVAANGRLRKFASGHWTVDLGTYNWTNSPIYHLYEDGKNRLWVATMGSGLFCYQQNQKSLHLTIKDGLPSDFVRCVTEDREGNIWVGMERGGLCRLKPAVFQTVSIHQGLSSDQVTSLCELTNEDLWVATDGDGLDFLSKDGETRHYASSQGLLNGHVWSVLQDRHGSLWAGTWDGLFRGGEDGFVDLSDGVRIGRQIFAIYEDHQGDMWLGQQGLGALTRFHDNEPALVRIPGASSSLDVRVMLEDCGGNFWVGTQDEGLFCRRRDKWVHFGKNDGLASDTIWSLYADSSGSIWIGTCGGGLSRWQNGDITTWTTKNGLINDIICQIFEDHKNNLWLGSFNGVFRVGKQQLVSGANKGDSIQCVGYDKTDGLPSVECAGGFQPSGLRSRDGKLWFPTVKGFAIVNPDEVPQNLLPPPVVIAGVLDDKNTLVPKENMVGMETLKGRLEVPAGEQRLEFQYTALSLTDPEKVRFKYELEGFDNTWVEAGNERSAVYRRVAPGNYRFHVIACNNDGVWNTVGDTIAVTMLPFFWQTEWFRALVVLLTLGAVASSVRYMVKQKMQRRIEYVERERAIEAERGRIANDIHDDLGAGLTEIAILSDLVQNTAGSGDAIHSDVSKIASKARTLAQSLDEIVWAMNLQNDSLDSFVTYACDFAQQYLQVAKIRCRLDVPGNLPNIPLTADIRHNLFMVLKEALNNIVKHAGATEVSIEITVEPRKLSLTIKDNGRGFGFGLMPDGRVDASAENMNRSLGKDGVINMRKRIESVGGRFRLQNPPTQGTHLSLTIPLPNL